MNPHVVFLDVVSRAAATGRLRSLEGHRVTTEPSKTPRLFNLREVK